MKKQPEKKDEIAPVKVAVLTQTVNLGAHRKALTLVVREAQAVAEITTADELDVAISILGRIQAAQKAVAATKKDILGPLSLAEKNIRALFKPVEDDAAFHERMLKDSMVQYRRREEEARLKKEAEIRRQLEAGRIKPETAAKKLEALPEPMANTISSSTGAKITFKVERTLVIDDPKKIPDEYWVIDEPAVKKALLAGEHVPGAHLESDKSGVSGS